MRCVTKPAILFLRPFEGINATSSQNVLFIWKSVVNKV